MVAQKLMGNTGDFLMYVVMMVSAITTLAGEVLATSSIVVYDIYQTYITPFRFANINILVLILIFFL